MPCQNYLRLMRTLRFVFIFNGGQLTTNFAVQTVNSNKKCNKKRYKKFYISCLHLKILCTFVAKILYYAKQNNFVDIFRNIIGSV